MKSNSQINTDILPPITTLYSELDAHFLTKWQIFWNNVPYSQSKFWFKTIDLGRSNDIKNLKRESLTILGRWLSGFVFLRRQNELVNPGSYPSIMCRLCGEAPERAIHLISDCEAVAQRRLQYLGKHTIDDPSDFEWGVNQMLKFLDTSQLLEMENTEADIDINNTLDIFNNDNFETLDDSNNDHNYSLGTPNNDHNYHALEFSSNDHNYHLLETSNNDHNDHNYALDNSNINLDVLSQSNSQRVNDNVMPLTNIPEGSSYHQVSTSEDEDVSRTP